MAPFTYFHTSFNAGQSFLWAVFKAGQFKTHSSETCAQIECWWHYVLPVLLTQFGTTLPAFKVVYIALRRVSLTLLT